MPARLTRQCNIFEHSSSKSPSTRKMSTFQTYFVKLSELCRRTPKSVTYPSSATSKSLSLRSHVDQIQIQQVFINLIVNAIEALEGQQVAPLVVLRAVTDSNGMLIQVIDNGPGVDDPDRIFDAFMTTKEKGMGIGLAVSRSIVEAHGGRLWAENNKTGGATFNVALPLSHASPTTAQIQEYA
jgi:C4-dicarboxylate-specific signal transduction histidine kinase